MAREPLARWPEVAVERETLAAALAERGLAADTSLGEDVALALALADHDPAALAIFDRELVPSIRGALVRFGRGADFVDEVVQRTRVKLLVDGKLAGYRGSGPLAAWIQIVALREALMIERVDRRFVENDALIQLALTEPELAPRDERLRAAFEAAFRAAVAALGERERTLLRLCCAEGVGTEGIARLFHVHRVTAFRWLRDARAQLLEETRARFAAATQVPSSQVDSMMRSLAASLSVSW